MELISVNLGRKQTLRIGKKGRETGIFKTPAAAAVPVTWAGLPGDVICNTKYHGGADQALYLYGTPDYEWWSRALGRTLLPGTFGENLTLSGLESGRIQIGDRFTIGRVCLEVTAPRIPCGTLAGRMGDRGFVKRFQAAGRPGVYCRVLQEGEIQAGDPVGYDPFPGPTIRAVDLFGDVTGGRLNAAEIRTRLALPIAARARKSLEKQLVTIQTGL